MPPEWPKYLTFLNALKMIGVVFAFCFATIVVITMVLAMIEAFS